MPRDRHLQGWFESSVVSGLHVALHSFSLPHGTKERCYQMAEFEDRKQEAIQGREFLLLHLPCFQKPQIYPLYVSGQDRLHSSIPWLGEGAIFLGSRDSARCLHTTLCPMEIIAVISSLESSPGISHLPKEWKLDLSRVFVFIFFNKYIASASLVLALDTGIKNEPNIVLFCN